MAVTKIHGEKQIQNATITTTQISASAGITDGQLASSYIYADGTRTLSADWALGSHKLTGLSAGTDPGDAVNKGQLDAISAGLDPKESVVCASTATINLSNPGTATFDGVTMVQGERILVKDQITASQNGIYDFDTSSSAMTRSDDADISAEVTAGMYCFVEEGTSYADTGWVLTTNDPIVLDTTSLTFTQFSGSGNITADSVGLTELYEVPDTEIIIGQTSGDAQDHALSGDVTMTNQGVVTIANDVVSLAKLYEVADTKIIIGQTGTDAAEYALSGDVTMTNGGVVSIGATKVTGAMLNDDCISAQTELAAGIASTDELMISDAGVLKRADISVFDTYFGTHSRSHAMTSTSDHTATNWSMFTSNGSGQVTEVANAAAGNVLLAGGTAAAPSWGQVDTAHIADDAVTIDKIYHFADTKILIGQTATAPAEYALSGDVTMTNGGVVSIGADKVLGSHIALFDDAYAATDTHFLVADGTDFVNVAMSGDATLANDGTVTIANLTPPADWVFNETPTGTINGSNLAFTTASNVMLSTTYKIVVFLNGIAQEPGSGDDYQMTAANTITFESGNAPQTGSSLLVTYLKA